ncbi:MAG: DUF1801 domain-containing protein [Treponema sp.]|jgi:uncharacterized protein YdhG (YjbR/CyaY superfamily)|nr:DUF1801 domain-containing protein [Treponema sp.]
MWQCPKCERKFKNTEQSHYCGKVETIDQYISEQDEKVKPHLAAVRETIRAAAPDAKEKISWQMPTFWQKENLIHFAAFKNHLGIYPGDLTNSPFKARLAGLATAKGTIRFPYDKIDLALIADITKWRVECVSKKKK